MVVVVFRRGRFSILLIDKRSYLVCTQSCALGNCEYEWSSSSMPADGPDPGEKWMSIPFWVLSDENTVIGVFFSSSRALNHIWMANEDLNPWPSAIDGWISASGSCACSFWFSCRC